MEKNLKHKGLKMETKKNVMGRYYNREISCKILERGQSFETKALWGRGRGDPGMSSKSALRVLGPKEEGGGKRKKKNRWSEGTCEACGTPGKTL